MVPRGVCLRSLRRRTLASILPDRGLLRRPAPREVPIGRNLDFLRKVVLVRIFLPQKYGHAARICYDARQLSVSLLSFVERLLVYCFDIILRPLLCSGPAVSRNCRTAGFFYAPPAVKNEWGPLTFRSRILAARAFQDSFRWRRFEATRGFEATRAWRPTGELSSKRRR